MDNLEKQLSKLPQAKLRRRADLKIKFKLYSLIVVQKLRGLFNFGFAGGYLRKSLTVVTLAVIIFIGTVWYAYADGTIAQGHTLYPLKRAVEAVEKQVTFSQSAKVKAYEKFSQRRLREAVILSQEKLDKSEEETKQLNEQIKKSLDEAVANIGAVVEKVKEQQDEPAVKEAAKKVEAKEALRDQYLQEIESNVEARRDQELLEKVKEIKKIMRRYRQDLRGKEEEKKNEPSERQESKGEMDKTIDESEQQVRGLKIEERPERKQEDNERPRRLEQSGADKEPLSRPPENEKSSTNEED